MRRVHNMRLCPQALLLRASYGGMQGDQAMLRRFAKLWEDRYGASPRLLDRNPVKFIDMQARSARCTLFRFAGRMGPPPPLPSPPGQFSPASAVMPVGNGSPMSWMQYLHEVHELNTTGEPLVPVTYSTRMPHTISYPARGAALAILCSYDLVARWHSCWHSHCDLQDRLNIIRCKYDRTYGALPSYWRHGLALEQVQWMWDCWAACAERTSPCQRSTSTARPSPMTCSRRDPREIFSCNMQSDSLRHPHQLRTPYKQTLATCLQEEQILEAGREVVDNDTDGLLQGIDDAFRKVLFAICGELSDESQTPSGSIAR